MFSWGRDKNVPIVPIVSSDRLAKLAEKMGASAVVVEGKEAGGHLGTERSVWDILPEVKGAVKIPVIAAGGIIEGRDVVEAVKLGADGVQMGTRFAASVESNASEAFKKLYVDSKREDVVLIKSPVGLPGRGLRSPFIDRLESDLGLPIENCVGCLKRCSRDFCIMDALVNACRDGDFNKALIFSGENVYKISEILPVKEIFRRLLKEIESC